MDDPETPAPDDVWPRGPPRVGEYAERSRFVDPEYVDLFSRLGGDHNPLYHDEDVASETRFGGIIAQGGVTSALLDAIVTEDLPGPGTVFLSVNWNFTAPVRPGDTITGWVEVTKVREDKPITELETEITRDDGTVVLTGSAVCYTVPIPADADE